MGMPAVRRYTVADLADFPDDGKRYELIRGELIVSPAPSFVHQRVLMRLTHKLIDYLEPLGLHETLFNISADVSWDDYNLVQPDLLVVRPEELSAKWSTVKNLRLAAEVISPSSRRRDRLEKRTLYQEHAVETYWVVDIEGRVVERWLPKDARPELVSDVLTWRIHSDAPEFSLPLAELFRDLPIPE